MNKRLILIPVAILVGLGLLWQAQRFFGGYGIFATKDMSQKIAEHSEQIEILKAENDALKAEIYELKNGYETVEAIARQELSMIKEGETLFLYGEKKQKELEQEHSSSE